MSSNAFISYVLGCFKDLSTHSKTQHVNIDGDSIDYASDMHMTVGQEMIAIKNKNARNQWSSSTSSSSDSASCSELLLIKETLGLVKSYAGIKNRGMYALI